MKKYIGIVGLALLGSIVGCGSADVNTQLESAQVEFNRRFPYAMVRLPDGTIIKGGCEEYHAYSRDDFMGVTIEGVEYQTSYENVCLLSEAPD